jgi:hypothetical protein
MTGTGTFRNLVFTEAGETEAEMTTTALPSASAVTELLLPLIGNSVAQPVQGVLGWRCRCCLESAAANQQGSL